MRRSATYFVISLWMLAACSSNSTHNTDELGLDLDTHRTRGERDSDLESSSESLSLESLENLSSRSVSYYVSASSGDDSYDGKTAQSPLRTLDTALRKARYSQYATIHLAEGFYGAKDQTLIIPSLRLLIRSWDAQDPEKVVIQNNFDISPGAFVSFYAVKFENFGERAGQISLTRSYLRLISCLAEFKGSSTKKSSFVYAINSGVVMSADSAILTRPVIDYSRASQHIVRALYHSFLYIRGGDAPNQRFLFKNGNTEGIAAIQLQSSRATLENLDIVGSGAAATGQRGLLLSLFSEVALGLVAGETLITDQDIAITSGSGSRVLAGPHTRITNTRIGFQAVSAGSFRHRLTEMSNVTIPMSQSAETYDVFE